MQHDEGDKSRSLYIYKSTYQKSNNLLNTRAFENYNTIAQLKTMSCMHDTFFLSDAESDIMDINITY